MKISVNFHQLRFAFGSFTKRGKHQLTGTRFNRHDYQEEAIAIWLRLSNELFCCHFDYLQ